jgi:hypothetical protein
MTASKTFVSLYSSDMLGSTTERVMKTNDAKRKLRRKRKMRRDAEYRLHARSHTPHTESGTLSEKSMAAMVPCTGTCLTQQTYITK